MGNKCKICGYRFKSKDEEICPECFTAREDDISCARYSGKDHTHRKTTYAGDFMETGDSFVQKELRNERNNQFARENFGARANAGLDLSRSAQTYDRSRFERSDYNYDFSGEYRQIMAQSYPDQPQPKPQQPQQTAYQRFTAQQQRQQTTTSGFTPAGQMYAQRNAARTQYNSFGQRKKGNGAAAIFVLLLFVGFFIAGIISAQNDNKSSYSSRKSTTTTTQRTTTATTTKTKRTTTQGSTSKIENESFRVIGSSARIEETRVTPDALMLHLRAARGIHAFVRIRLPKAPEDLSAADTDGHPVQLCSAWDAETRTLLLDYRSTGSGILVSGSLK